MDEVDDDPRRRGSSPERNCAASGAGRCDEISAADDSEAPRHCRTTAFGRRESARTGRR